MVADFTLKDFVFFRKNCHQLIGEEKERRKMGRLINADELKERILDVSFQGMGLYKANRVVNETPTAYDLEAVVKEVQDIGTRFCTTVHCNDECENCDHGSIMKAVIDVVRKGGVK